MAGSGFGGQGLDRLDQERDAKEKAERKAYGEPEEEKQQQEAVVETKKEGDDMTFGNFKVEVKRGPAPDSSKGLLGVAGAAAAARRLAQAKEEEKLQNSLRAAQEAAERAGKDTAAHKQALSVVAKLNAQLRAGALRFWISRLWDFHLPREAALLQPHDPTHFERVLSQRIAHPLTLD